VNEHEPVVGVEGTEGVVPFSDAVTLATVVASAPNDWSNEMIAEICVEVSAAASARGATTANAIPATNEIATTADAILVSE
jgi:hypothetical protein